MSHKPPIVNISTPAKIERFSRGFYQMDEESLYVPLVPGGRFYSYLDSTITDANRQNNRSLNFDIDRSGNLTFIKIRLARDKWPVRDQIDIPDTVLTAEVQFRQFREQISKFDLISNPAKDCLCLIFPMMDSTVFPDEKRAIYRITSDLYMEFSGEASISRLWILNIVDDRCAREMAIWRKDIRSKSSPNK